MPIRLIRKRESGLGLFHLVFDADPAVSSSYQRAGQFMEVEAAGARAVFALACRPGSGALEFLVKNEGEPAGTLCAASQGDSFVCSSAGGDGFDLADVEGRDVHLFSMGSGIAPFRALIQVRDVASLGAKSMTLWQGAFTEEHLPFKEEYNDWELRGVRVIPCLDRTSGPDAGNVVARLKAAAPVLDQALCFWIGSKGFGQAVGHVCAELGLPESMFRTNF